MSGLDTLHRVEGIEDGVEKVALLLQLACWDKLGQGDEEEVEQSDTHQLFAQTFQLYCFITKASAAAARAAALRKSRRL